jgi:hypothetical protein
MKNMSDSTRRIVVEAADVPPRVRGLHCSCHRGRPAVCSMLLWLSSKHYSIHLTSAAKYRVRFWLSLTDSSVR